MKIKILKLNLDSEKSLNSKEAVKLRGYLGQLFRENPYVHHHLQDGKLLYTYPRIQYKVTNEQFLLIGIKEGVDILKEVFYNINSINLKGNVQTILNKTIESNTSNFGVIDYPISYIFLTPWLALNQKNYTEWQSLSKKDRREKLKCILIGNILSMAKGLEYVVNDKIKAEVNVKPLLTTLKDTSMLGFIGKFQVNFDIPDYLGIGKSVSRGFGTVVKEQSYFST